MGRVLPHDEARFDKSDPVGCSDLWINVSPNWTQRCDSLCPEVWAPLADSLLVTNLINFQSPRLGLLIGRLRIPAAGCEPRRRLAVWFLTTLHVFRRPSNAAASPFPTFALRITPDPDLVTLTLTLKWDTLVRFRIVILNPSSLWD